MLFVCKLRQRQGSQPSLGMNLEQEQEDEDTPIILNHRSESEESLSRYETISLQLQT